MVAIFLIVGFLMVFLLFGWALIRAVGRYSRADCARIYQCKNPCYNRPDRCGLVKEKEVKKSE